MATLREAMLSGYPFTRDGIIGAYCYVNGYLVHHDNITNYLNVEWITKNSTSYIPMQWLRIGDLADDIWHIQKSVVSEGQVLPLPSFAVNKSKLTKDACPKHSLRECVEILISPDVLAGMISSKIPWPSIIRAAIVEQFLMGDRAPQPATDSLRAYARELYFYQRLSHFPEVCPTEVSWAARQQ